MNPSTMCREALVNELLGCSLPGPAYLNSLAPHCADADVSPLGAREARLKRVLRVAKELLLRELRRDMDAQPLISGPAALRDWLRIYCADLDHEVFLVIFLDAHHRVLGVEPMFRGTLTQTSVYPREVVKAALRRHAAAVAFAHNHPSGCPEPSPADACLTSTLKSALSLVDVRTLDHFIVAGDRLLSMAERGLM